MPRMLEQMLDLDRGIVSEAWIGAVKFIHNRQGVPDPVEKVRVAEGDVRGSRRHLPPDVLDHHFSLDNAKTALIDRHNRAMAAQVFAASACFRVPDHALLAVVPIEFCIVSQSGEPPAVRDTEPLPGG